MFGTAGLVLTTSRSSVNPQRLEYRDNFEFKPVLQSMISCKISQNKSSIHIYIHCQFIALVTILEALFGINSSVGQDHSVDVRELSHARVCLKKA